MPIRSQSMALILDLSLFALPVVFRYILALGIWYKKELAYICLSEMMFQNIRFLEELTGFHFFDDLYH